MTKQEKEIKEFELSKTTTVVTDILFYLCIFAIFVAIWEDTYRWKIIASSIFLFIVLLLWYTIKEHMWEKKNKKKIEPCEGYY